jgi:hypothetical protein
VQKALSALDSEGRWLKDDQIDAAEFSKHLTAMAYYIEAATNSVKP